MPLNSLANDESQTRSSFKSVPFTMEKESWISLINRKEADFELKGIGGIGCKCNVSGKTASTSQFSGRCQNVCSLLYIYHRLQSCAGALQDECFDPAYTQRIFKELLVGMRHM